MKTKEMSVFLKKERVLVILCIVFLAALSFGLNYRTFMWDEVQNTVFPIFTYDFLGKCSAGEFSGISEMKAYGISYHSHYPFFLNMIHHPPVHRAITLLGFLAFGVNEVGARVPTMIFGVIGVFLIFFFSRRMFKERKVATIASALLVLSPMYYEYSRMAMIEIVLTVLVMATMYFFYMYYKKGGRINYVMFGILLGLSFMTKYPAILIVPSLLLFIIWKKKFRLLKDLNIYKALAIAAVISVPWFVFLFSAPSSLGIPTDMIFGAYSRNVVLSFVDPVSVASFFLQEMSWVIGALGIIGLLFALKRRDDTDVFLISWIVCFYAFFIFYVGPSVGHLHRFLMPTVPAFILLASRSLNFDILPKVKKHGPALIIIILAASLVLSVDYNIRVHERYPIEDAATWVLENTVEGDGILYLNFAQQFFFQKHDRDLKLFTAHAGRVKDFNTLFFGTYATELREEYGIETPKYKYMITWEPVAQKRGDVLQYIEENSDMFKPIKTFSEIQLDGGEYTVKIYELEY